jgi:Chalcone isomerase-like
MRTRLAVLALLVAGLACTPLRAATVAGVSLDDTVTVDRASLVLDGAALRSKYFFKVYVGALYLPERESDPAKVLAADVMRRMSMHFLRNVSSNQLCNGWKEGLAANSPDAGADVQAGFERLCTLMRDVHDGSVLLLTYRPGRGTEIVFDGTIRGTIEGKPFADALLGCWIGPQPDPGADFKKGVLGG